MSGQTTVKVYKYKNIAAALAVLLLILVGLSTSCGAKISEKRSGTAEKDTVESSAAEPVEKDNGKRLTKSYAYKEMQNGIALSNGLLLQVSSEHPFTGQINGGEALYSFMFDENGEQVLAASYPSDEGLPAMLKALNKMASDFTKTSGLNTLMVSSMVPENDGGAKTDEAYIGSCVELMLYDGINGTFENFTGEDEYSWIPNNCYKYGFVMRGTNRLRYIGNEAADLIRFLGASDSSADIEKLQTIIKDYTFEEPMYFSNELGTEYAAYFVPVEDGTTTTSIPVPTREDESEFPSYISGNNVDGYIVIVNMSSASESGDVPAVSSADDQPETEN